ncbi:MAG: PilZ domain-containing protein [Treponema sp.]|jgi:hypothetical protein|nr:PilZ domain-containing protein [Treponema sp.]
MSSSNNQSEILGKKIFFVYPAAAVQNEVVAELIQQEYEVYVVKDHVNLQKVLKHYPDSIVFADIDERLPEQDWETWIRNIMSDPATANVLIGIVSANNDEVLQRKYVNSVKVQCGYVTVKANIKNSIKYILDILNACEAKGRRKYIRVTTGSENMPTINIPHNGTYINGVIKDISSAGLSCSFAPDPELGKNTLCSDIQIKLQGMLLKVEGIIFGSRMEGQEKIYVLVFTQRTDPVVRMKIRKYIQTAIQAKMEAELK